MGEGTGQMFLKEVAVQIAEDTVTAIFAATVALFVRVIHVNFVLHFCSL